VKRPAVSFKDTAIGEVVTMLVAEPASKVHSRDYESGEPAYWDDARTQPKYAAVVNGSIDGEDVSLWAQMPSALFAAIADAQVKAGQKIDTGGTLRVKYTGDKPNSKNPRLKPAKQFAAEYVPPVADAFAADDEPPF
jgi:hypothetical protein